MCVISNETIVICGGKAGENGDGYDSEVDEASFDDVLIFDVKAGTMKKVANAPFAFNCVE